MAQSIPERQLARLRQVAAIPMRSTSAGAIEVLLVTSRDSGRWVVPKGWPWPKVPDREAAAGEAWEEAGVRGKVSHDPIGHFRYAKRRGNALVPIHVDVYGLQVRKEADSWPEAEDRRRAWFAPQTAARLVDEPELKGILLGLCDSGRTALAEVRADASSAAGTAATK